MIASSSSSSGLLLRRAPARHQGVMERLRFLDSSSELPGYAGRLKSQNCSPRVRESLALPTTFGSLVGEERNDLVTRVTSKIREMLFLPPSSGDSTSTENHAYGALTTVNKASSCTSVIRRNTTASSSSTNYLPTTALSPSTSSSPMEQEQRGLSTSSSTVDHYPLSWSPSSVFASSSSRGLIPAARAFLERNLVATRSTSPMWCPPGVSLVPRLSPSHTVAFGYPRDGQIIPSEWAAKFPNILVDPVRLTPLKGAAIDRRCRAQIFLASRLHGQDKPTFLAVYSGGGALAGVTTGADPWRRAITRCLDEEFNNWQYNSSTSTSVFASQSGAVTPNAVLERARKEALEGVLADRSRRLGGSGRAPPAFLSLHLSDSWVARRLAGTITKVFLRKRLAESSQECSSASSDGKTENNSIRDAFIEEDAYVYRGRWLPELRELFPRKSEHKELPSFFLVDRKGFIRWRACGIPDERAENALKLALRLHKKELWG
ncbi:unnamed protein product [Amoebophrya sp. A25]|nr:unnamed protein product [Amoebophrya sp. A25]|eukprot:GSA25T00024710001.1